MAVRPMKVWNAATSTWDDVAVSQRGDVVNATDYAAKGDIIAGTGAGTYDNLAAGSNGQVLVADSGATAGVRYVDPPTNRNLIINGAMQVHQRGTSSAGITTGGYYTADRWITYWNSTGGAFTQSVEADAPNGSGFNKSLKYLCTTALASPGSQILIRPAQLFEGQDLQRLRYGTESAKSVTLSFWVKSNVTGTYVCELHNMDAGRTISAAYAISSSDTWENKQIVFAGDTVSGFDNDNALSLRVQFFLAAGSDYTTGTLATTWQSSANSANRAVGQTNLAAATDNYWQVTGVQLETGSVATPFEFEPYEATLRKCQRYYQIIGDGVDNTSNPLVNAFAYSSGDARGAFRMVQTMRAAPTLVVVSGTDYYRFLTASGNDGLNGFIQAWSSRNSILLYNNTDVSTVAGTPGILTIWNPAGYVALDAEL